MPIRNPFGRRAGAQDENIRAEPNGPRLTVEPPGFERVDTVGSKASSLSGKSSRADAGAYKLSVVNDSGVYLPPSPTEEPAEKSPWSPRRYLPSLPSTARSSCEKPAGTPEIEHFSISRESFDSYRRSFDISARSPVSHDLPARQSLDSARLPRRPPSRRLPRRVPTTEEEEEAFEEVGLGDPAQQQHQQQQGPPGGKRRGIFSMFEGQDSGSGSPAVSRFLPGRRRNQSGQGAELGSIEGEGRSRAGEEVV